MNLRIFNEENIGTQHTYFIHARKENQHPCLTIEHVYAYTFELFILHPTCELYCEQPISNSAPYNDMCL
jgi:hypothetical protein